MKSVYEASNSVEAHMILNMLENQGMHGRVDGEYLQGGVGELQATGLVRVMVDESDYDQAKGVIKEWESSQPSSVDSKPAAAKQRSGVTNFVTGLAIGVIAMFVYYQTPVTEDGVDYNRDGNLDEVWTYKNYKIAKAELDRNFDGEVDFVYNHDRKGIIQSSISDDNFDGLLDTKSEYRYGNPIKTESDTDGDGFYDLVYEYKNGVVSRQIFLDEATGKELKINNFGPFKIKSVELDSDRDGVLDKLVTYDDLEEVFQESEF